MKLGLYKRRSAKSLQTLNPFLSSLPLSSVCLHASVIGRFSVPLSMLSPSLPNVIEIFCSTGWFYLKRNKSSRFTVILKEKVTKRVWRSPWDASSAEREISPFLLSCPQDSQTELCSPPLRNWSIKCNFQQVWFGRTERLRGGRGSRRARGRDKKGLFSDSE